MRLGDVPPFVFMFVVIFLHFIFPNGIYVNVPALLCVALDQASRQVPPGQLPPGQVPPWGELVQRGTCPGELVRGEVVLFRCLLARGTCPGESCP